MANSGDLVSGIASRYSPLNRQASEMRMRQLAALKLIKLACSLRSAKVIPGPGDLSPTSGYLSRGCKIKSCFRTRDARIDIRLVLNRIRFYNCFAHSTDEIRLRLPEGLVSPITPLNFYVQLSRIFVRFFARKLYRLRSLQVSRIVFKLVANMS